MEVCLKFLWKQQDLSYKDIFYFVINDLKAEKLDLETLLSFF